jgi:hypothetical protein
MTRTTVPWKLYALPETAGTVSEKDDFKLAEKSALMILASDPMTQSY